MRSCCFSWLPLLELVLINQDLLHAKAFHIKRRPGYSRYTVVSSPLLAANQNRNKNDENAEQPAVSDAYALRACQAYWKRQNTTVAQERKEQRKNAEYFFWDDVSQLRGFGEEDLPLSVNELESENDDPQIHMTQVQVADAGMVLDESATEDYGTSTSTPALLLDPIEEDEEDGYDEDVGNVANSVPSSSHLRRSRAAQRKWSDPEWKKTWHEKRWGPHRRRRKSPPPEPSEDLLQEVSSWSEEKIAHAIDSYVVSNTKRATTRQETLANRAPTWRPSNHSSVATRPIVEIANNDSWYLNSSALEASQKERSERAKRAYQKRVHKQSSTSTLDGQRKIDGKQESRGPSAYTEDTTHASPLEAITGILEDLAAHRWPSMRHVTIILQPTRLRDRRDVLRRILYECFGLRGKCVPVNEKTAFVTNCSVDQLGTFVLSLLREQSIKTKKAET